MDGKGQIPSCAGLKFLQEAGVTGTRLVFASSMLSTAEPILALLQRLGRGDGKEPQPSRQLQGDETHREPGVRGPGLATERRRINSVMPEVEILPNWYVALQLRGSYGVQISRGATVLVAARGVAQVLVI